MNPTQKELELGRKLTNARQLSAALALSDASELEKEIARQQVHDLQNELDKAEKRRTCMGMRKKELISEITDINGKIENLLMEGTQTDEIHRLSSLRESLQDMVCRETEYENERRGRGYYPPFFEEDFV